MQFEITGKLIVKSDTQVISDKFKKRELVIEKKETGANGFEFVDTIKFQLTQNNVDLLNNFKVGQDVKVSFNIRGNKWEKDGKVSYFVNLDAWRIDAVAGSEPAKVDNAPDPDGTEDDKELPF